MIDTVSSAIAMMNKSNLWQTSKWKSAIQSSSEIWSTTLLSIDTLTQWYFIDSVFTKLFSRIWNGQSSLFFSCWFTSGSILGVFTLLFVGYWSSSCLSQWHRSFISESSELQCFLHWISLSFSSYLELQQTTSSFSAMHGASLSWFQWWNIIHIDAWPTLSNVQLKLSQLHQVPLQLLSLQTQDLHLFQSRRLEYMLLSSLLSIMEWSS